MSTFRFEPMHLLRPTPRPRATMPLLALVLPVAFGMGACATSAPNPNPERTATRLAQTYGPRCEATGPVNTQAWGYCVARSYDRAVARHGGACSDWQLRGAASYEDCVMDASIKADGLVAASSTGPYCVALNTGGDVNYGACK